MSASRWGDPKAARAQSTRPGRSVGREPFDQSSSRLAAFGRGSCPTAVAQTPPFRSNSICAITGRLIDADQVGASILIGSTMRCLICLMLLAVLALPSPAFAACEGKFAARAKYAGNYPDGFLRDAAIKSRIQTLLGPAMRRFLESLQVSGPVALIDCELTVEGNAPHEGGIQNAILSFNLSNGAMTAGLLDHGRVTIVTSEVSATKPSNYSYLPAHVRDWAFVAINGFRARGTPPAGIIVLPSKQAVPR